MVGSRKCVAQPCDKRELTSTFNECLNSVRNHPNCRLLSLGRSAIGGKTAAPGSSDTDDEPVPWELHESGSKNAPNSSISRLLFNMLSVRNLAFLAMLTTCSAIILMGPSNLAVKWTESRNVQDSRKLNETDSKSKESVDQPVQVDTSSITTPSISYVPQRQLIEIFNFTSKSTLNFLHLHKTGGQTMKSMIGKYYSTKIKKDGTKVSIQNLCYKNMVPQADGSVAMKGWRCDLAKMKQLSKSDRDKVEVVFGHQYLYDGVPDILSSRNVHTFTILRHPFDRKLSFFLHFFVRSHERNLSDVTLYEVREFLLRNRVRIDANLGRDTGPNYFAGRLLSDGELGFSGTFASGVFMVGDQIREEVVSDARTLLKSFVFVGLQNQPQATMCVVRSIVHAFDGVLNLRDPSRAHEFGIGVAMSNKGTYSMSAQEIWDSFTEEERLEFERMEYVDLEIYREAERLFEEQVTRLGCQGH